MGLFDHLYHLDWSARYPLHYYYNDGRHVKFDKYVIDMFGNIYNNKTGYLLSCKKVGDYDMASVCDSTGKQCGIYVARAVLSSFIGNPPSLEYSAEHIDCTNKDNNNVCELTWINLSGQSKNRIMSRDLKCAKIIVRDDLEMTAKEWVKYLNEEKSYQYTESMLFHYAQRKTKGFSYKVYEDLVDETWYHIKNSENKKGHWEISDKNRIAYVSTHTRNVIDETRFGFDKKYPVIRINGKSRRIHDVAFETFYPEEYAMKKPEEMILHKFDNKLDFRPHVLYIGDASMNGKDSHSNGCHDGTKTARRPCCSYINDVFERRHESLDAAEKYLRSNGHSKADHSAIHEALKTSVDNKVSVRYGRTWKCVD